VLSEGGWACIVNVLRVGVVFIVCILIGETVEYVEVCSSCSGDCILLL